MQLYLVAMLLSARPGRMISAPNRPTPSEDDRGGGRGGRRDHRGSVSSGPSHHLVGRGNASRTLRMKLRTASHLRVYLWSNGTRQSPREIQLVQMGWSQHPRIRLVQSPHDVDLIVWTSTRNRLESEAVPPGHAPVVLLDYADGCVIHQYRNRLGDREVGYFKRSWVERRDGILAGPCVNDPTVQPFAYSAGVATKPYGPQDDPEYGAGPRYYTIVSTLREGHKMPTSVRSVHSRRMLIANWTREFALSPVERAHRPAEE